MNELQIFENPAFGQIRTTTIDSEPWFVAVDVCRALEIGNTSDAIRRLDEDEKNTLVLNDGNRGNPNIGIINEPGLYALVLGSRKPEARAFKRWITHEVIPAIRKHGGYIMGQEHMTDAELMAKALLTAQRTIEDRERRLEAANAKIEADRPKVIFADAVSASKSSILIGELAKILTQNGVKIGQNRLFEYMRTNGYLCSRRGEMHNLPTQKAMEKGLFVIKKTAVTGSDGKTRVTNTVKVTAKGQRYFVEEFLREG